MAPKKKGAEDPDIELTGGLRGTPPTWELLFREGEKVELKPDLATVMLLPETATPPGSLGYLTFSSWVFRVGTCRREALGYTTTSDFTRICAGHLMYGDSGQVGLVLGLGDQQTANYAEGPRCVSMMNTHPRVCTTDRTACTARAG
jgi:hypothetical protein